VISFETGSALVFGMNIGTTVTAWLAAMGATTEARRAALAHTLFNGLGVVLIAPFFLPVFVPLLHRFYPAMSDPVTNANGTFFPYVTAPIAMVHTGFNVINTLLFLPFLGYFTALVRRLVPGGDVKEQPRLTLLEPQMMAPSIAVEQARQEVDLMATCTHKMLADFRVILSGEKKEELERGILEAEDRLDRVQHEVSTFLGKVMSAHLPAEVAYRARMLLRVADEYESVSDEVRTLLKMIQRMRANGMALSHEGKTELLSLHDLCAHFQNKVTEAFQKGKAYAPDVLTHLHADSEAISQRIKDIRAAQFQRLTDHNPHAEPLKIVMFMDLLNVYRRLKEDCLNIGEAMLDERGADNG